VTTKHKRVAGSGGGKNENELCFELTTCACHRDWIGLSIILVHILPITYSRTHACVQGRRPGKVVVVVVDGSSDEGLHHRHKSAVHVRGRFLLFKRDARQRERIDDDPPGRPAGGVARRKSQTVPTGHRRAPSESLRSVPGRECVESAVDAADSLLTCRSDQPFLHVRAAAWITNCVRMI
jgi:hypothetical protein